MLFSVIRSFQTLIVLETNTSCKVAVQDFGNKTQTFAIYNITPMSYKHSLNPTKHETQIRRTKVKSRG